MSDYNAAIKLANDKRVESIYSSCLIEGIDCTLHDVDMFLKGMENAELPRHHSHFIWCMKEAWNFVMSQLGTANNLTMLRELNKLVLYNGLPDCGAIRTIEVSMGGTSWKPDIPITGVIIEDLEKLNMCRDPESRAIAMFCYVTRCQMFTDGNKRVAQLIANKILIENGIGVLRIKENAVNDLKSILVGWYETGNPFNLFNLIKDRCIERI